MSERLKYQDRFMGWINRHYGPGPCKFCDHKHDGYHTYMSHLQQEHPEKWDEFEVWAGMTAAGDGS